MIDASNRGTHPYAATLQSKRSRFIVRDVDSHISVDTWGRCGYL
jgi:hypothetical protein